VEKQLELINQFLGTSFSTMEDAMLIINSLKTSNVAKYDTLQLLLQANEQDEQGEKPTLPESVKVNPSSWAKSLKSSNMRKGFATLTGVAKDLEGLEGFQNFNVEGTEVRVKTGKTLDTKTDNYLELMFIYDLKLISFKAPISKLATVENEILEGLPFQFSTCEFVETNINGSDVQYIKYSFGPM
jgi:hypothetical protein